MANVIPFGKYKGRDVSEIIETDPNYVEWLTLQDWFIEKFRSIYDEIVRGGSRERTPEHNAIQIKFIDDDFCLNFANYIGLFSDPDNAKFHARKMEDIFDVSLWFKEGDETLVVHIEIKPSLGDDYPLVLRQMKNQQQRWAISRLGPGAPSSEIQRFLRSRSVEFLLLYEKFSAVGATLRQVEKMFWESGRITVEAFTEDVEGDQEG